MRLIVYDILLWLSIIITQALCNGYPLLRSLSRSHRSTVQELTPTVLTPATPIQIVQAGSTVTYHCTGQSRDSDGLSIHWLREGGQLPPGTSFDDAQGLLIIRDVKFSDSGVYVCEVSDGVNIGMQKLTLTVETTKSTKPTAVIKPRYLDVKEGEPVEFRCVVSGNPPPQVSWVRVSGETNPTAIFDNGLWKISSVRKSDEGAYKCVAQNSAGYTEISTVLYVTERQGDPALPLIDPTEWIGGPTDTVRLVCTASRNAKITWSREQNLPLPRNAVERDGVLTIYNPSAEDSGYYICTAISYEGIESTQNARITIQSSDNLINLPPVVKIQPPKQTVAQGSLAEVQCVVTGQPTPNITWTKLGGQLDAHIQTTGTTLRIINPQVSDRGIYVCHASNNLGESQDNAVIEVEPRELPVIKLWPETFQAIPVGGSALLREAIDRPIPHTVSQNRGVLQFRGITSADAGRYVCKASNNAGTAETVAEVFVEEYHPNIPSNLRDIDAYVGNYVQLNCSLNSRSTIEWSKERGEIPSNSYRLGNILELIRVKSEDSGRYVCRVTYENGVSSSSYINLRVNLYGATCSQHEFQCRSRECIDKIYLCDGIVNCYDQSDEQYCFNRHYRHYDPQQEIARVVAPTPPPPPSVPAKVLIQIRASAELINIGDTVDIQCDASGARDARIRWTRLNEASLPLNAQDYGSVIRLSDVIMSDSGIYRCIADTSEGVFDKDYELIIQGTTDVEIECRGDRPLRCSDGSTCFGDTQKCDGNQDCDDNSDEENCAPDQELLECSGDEPLRCSDGSRCYGYLRQCNGAPYCDDKSDEENCDLQKLEAYLNDFPLLCPNGLRLEVMYSCDDYQ